MEWGEVPHEDLAMTSCSADTNAAALILGDYAESFLNNDFHLEYKRHLRVKLFSQRAYDLATMSISVWEDDDLEEVDDIEGVTYYIDDEGDVEEVELDSDDIKEEKVVSGLTRYVFTLPALRPGCVFEVTYRIRARRLWLIRDWEFQWTEPVRWSEYRLTTPRNISYAAVFQGYEQYHVAETQEKTLFVSGPAEVILGKMAVPGRVQRWVLKDAPAVRSEPYMTTTDDYVNRVDLQLAQTAFIGDGVRNYINSWSLFAEELLDADFFGDRLDPDGDIREKTAEVIAGQTSPSRTARAIYEWVVKNMTWSGSYRRTPSRDIDEVLAEGKGSSAELTFLLIAMFRAAGLEADPVLISTRSNRAIQEVYPIEHQFNHVIARVNAGDVFYVDGCDRNRPFHMPPRSVLNRRGFIVGKNVRDFVTVTSNRKDAIFATVTMTIGEEGSVRGTAEATYLDYGAMDGRKTMREKDDPAATLVRSILGAADRNFTVDSCSAGDLDSINYPLRARGSFSGENAATVMGDLLYVNPHIPLSLTANPLRLPDRKYPVDYSTPVQRNAEVTIVPPPGYIVKEVPKRVTFSGAEGTVNFNRSAVIEGDAVKVVYTLTIVDSSYPAKHYSSLRDVYANAVQSFGEQIVFEKKP